MSDNKIKQATLELLQEAGIGNDIIIYDSKISAFEARVKTENSDLEHFYISADTEIIGKPQAISSTKTRLNLAHKLKIENEIKFYFIDEHLDGRELRAYCIKSLTEEFYLYRLISNEREHIILSREKLEPVETKLKGMALRSATSTEINKRFSLRGYVNLFFVNEHLPTIKILTNEELLLSIKSISKSQFLSYLFHHSSHQRIYEQPEDYKLLMGVVLLSGKYEGYPLHLLTIGDAGSGKTMKQESLNQKFNESLGIFEASNSRLKGLVPSFKEKPASLGYILNCNRIALIDELFKMIESSFNDSHATSSMMSNALQQFNPLLEHKERTVSSGNDNSFYMKPTAKVIADCNPISNKYTLPEHLNVIDATTLSRFILWIIDSDHYKFIKEKKQNIPNTQYSGDFWNTLMYNNIFLSIFDTLNSTVCKIDNGEILRTFNGAFATIRDERIKPLLSARGLHHTYLLVDGICKLRCLFEEHNCNFIANEKDYDEAQKLLIRIIQTMQSPVGRSN